MTYLELVNNVLRRLRERPVETVSQTAYSDLIGVLVNDAKEEVENAWQWGGLRTTLQGNTEAGKFNLELQSTESRLTIMDVWNDTTNNKLIYKSSEWFNNTFLSTDTPDTGEPKYWTYNGVSADGDSLIDLYPIPDGAYSMLINAVIRSVDLVEDIDILLVPDKPTALLAYAYAVEERGEDGGQPSSRAFSVATKSLGDAISLDVAKHPEEVVWYSV